MYGNDLLSQLAKNLEDEDEARFTASSGIKLLALNEALKTVVRLLHNNYLEDLHKDALNISVQSGVVTVSAAVMGAEVFGGAAEGVVYVKETNGGFIDYVDISALSTIENEWLSPSIQKPSYHTKGRKIIIQPDTIRNVDVTFIKVPAPIVANGTTVIELDDAHSGILLLLAAEMCWRLDDKAARAKLAGDSAVGQINALNAKFNPGSNK